MASLNYRHTWKIGTLGKAWAVVRQPPHSTLSGSPLFTCGIGNSYIGFIYPFLTQEAPIRPLRLHPSKETHHRTLVWHVGHKHWWESFMGSQETGENEAVTKGLVCGQSNCTSVKASNIIIKFQSLISIGHDRAWQVSVGQKAMLCWEPHVDLWPNLVMIQTYATDGQGKNRVQYRLQCPTYFWLPLKVGFGPTYFPAYRIRITQELQIQVLAFLGQFLPFLKKHTTPTPLPCHSSLAAAAAAKRGQWETSHNTSLLNSCF